MNSPKRTKTSLVIYCSGFLVLSGLILISTKSMEDVFIIGIPIKVLGGIVLLAGLFIFSVWFSIGFIKSLIFLAKNYRLIPKVFTLKRDVEKLQEESKRIESDALRLERLVKAHAANEKNS